MSKTTAKTIYSLPVQGALYHIRQRGSRYNILGPNGQVFKTYKSAGVVGPRWEELTRTPWPYSSCAYSAGDRLRQLRQDISLPEQPQPRNQLSSTSLDSLDTAPEREKQRAPRQAKPPSRPVPMGQVLALPAPCINLQLQARLVEKACRQPLSIFSPAVEQALWQEVDYHRPQAAWAQAVLDLLAKAEHRTLQMLLKANPGMITDPVALLASALEPPLPNVLDIYHNPLLALHPDLNAVRAMLQEEARGVGVLAEFARKLDLVLWQWRHDTARLRLHLMRQTELHRQGKPPNLDHLLKGPAYYRIWRLNQNRQRNLQRAAEVDGAEILAKHLAWQEKRLAVRA